MTPTPTLVDAPSALHACVFKLGDGAFALPVANVREVLVVEEWTAVPLAPRQVIGVANRRGQVLPVADPHKALGLPPRPPGRRLRTLVVAARDGEVAIVVDDVIGLETFDELVAFGDAARSRYGGLALGLLRWQGRLLTLLDADRLAGALRGEGQEHARESTSATGFPGRSERWGPGGHFGAPGLEG